LRLEEWRLLVKNYTERKFKARSLFAKYSDQICFNSHRNLFILLSASDEWGKNLCQLFLPRAHINRNNLYMTQILPSFCSFSANNKHQLKSILILAHERDFCLQNQISHYTVLYICRCLSLSLAYHADLRQ
jgi:hypothetical protein